MRTSATGIRRAFAFTLIEVLVVVTIVGIVLAVAAVNLIPSDAQAARRDASSLALDLEQARDTAWFGGMPTAVSFKDGRVHKWRLTGSSWQGETRSERAFESEVRVLAMHVDGQPLEAGERLVFMPDGLGTPFRVALEVRGRPWAIEGDAAGAVKLVER
jgi:general secretion pathway protein H